MSRETIYALRQLRDRGYIHGFMTVGDHCFVFMDNGAVEVDEDGVRQLVARTRLWTILGLDESHLEVDEPKAQRPTASGRARKFPQRV